MRGAREHLEANLFRVDYVLESGWARFVCPRFPPVGTVGKKSNASALGGPIFAHVPSGRMMRDRRVPHTYTGDR